MSTRCWRSCWPRKASPRSRTIAYVDAAGNLSSLEGLDEQTAQELQNRARDYLDRIAAEQDAKRRELGVADDVAEIEGVTLPMLVALGEADIKTVEDLAGCATDDLVGWTERKAGETVKHKGALLRSRRLVGGSRGHHHGGARQGGLDRGAGEP